MGRLFAAIFKPGEATMQLYVDDLAVAIRGRAAEWRHRFTVWALCWEILGAPFAWPKAQRGTDVVWLFAGFAANSHGLDPVVAVSMPEAKSEKLIADVFALLKHNTVKRTDFRSYAVSGSWCAGLVPWLRPCVGYCKTAATEPIKKDKAGQPLKSGPGGPHIVYTKQVEHGVKSRTAFFKG